MTLKDIAINNLRRRKGKAMFVLAGLLIGVSTVVTLLTLVETMKHDINHKLEMYGANILITPKMENLSLTYGGLSLGGVSFDMKELKEEELGNVWNIKNKGNLAAVGPIVLGPVNINGKRILLAGVDFQAFNTLRPWWNLKGKTPENEGLIAGSDVVRLLGVKQGSMVKIKGKELPLTGVLETTGSQDDGIIFAPLALAQMLLGKEGRISMAEVAALCSGCPIPEMVEQISGVLPGANVMAIQQVVKGRIETLNHFEKFSYGVSALVLFVGSLMVLVTMMGSVRERTIEIGILSAMGFRKGHIIRTILLESAIIAGIAGILGYGVGYGVTKMVVPFLSEGHGGIVPFNPVMAVSAFLLAIFLGLISSAYPAFMASRLDPNEALRAL